MKTKSAAESKRVLEKFLSEMRRLRWHVTRLRCDLGSEYVNNRKTNPIQNSNLSRCLVSTRKFVDVQKKISRSLRRRKGLRISMMSSNGITERFASWQTPSCIMVVFLQSFWSTYIDIATGCLYNRLMHTHLGRLQSHQDKCRK